ncbi:Transient receptor potential cation channel subfamily M member 2 [Lamellibrachia satsuma]|nr:Transient receptor potential cation channel subfamily M member 2 [Lamellibrachia satsuma]
MGDDVVVCLPGAKIEAITERVKNIVGSGTLACDASPTANSTLPRCPENTAFVPSTLMAIYILFANVLMLNLLIAMFSYTFNKIQTNTDEHWFFQRYFLIKEYHDRPPLPPPFIVISHIVLLLRCCFCKPKPGQTNSDFQMSYPESLNKELILWENVTADEYVRRTQIDRQQSLESRVRETQDSLLQQTEVTGVSHDQYHVTQAGAGLVGAPGQCLSSM